MFKTSQPNPERSHKDRVNELGKTEPQFETLVDFSNWIDLQLSKLESKHQQFSTADSIRLFFKRN